MPSDIDLYIKEIKKIPLLTVTEEIELGYKIKNGDKLAVNKLVEHNLRLVIPIANRNVNRGVRLEDLIQ